MEFSDLLLIRRLRLEMLCMADGKRQEPFCTGLMCRIRFQVTTMMAEAEKDGKPLSMVNGKAFRKSCPNAWWGSGVTGRWSLAASAQHPCLHLCFERSLLAV